MHASREFKQFNAQHVHQRSLPTTPNTRAHESHGSGVGDGVGDGVGGRGVGGGGVGNGVGNGCATIENELGILT